MAQFYSSFFGGGGGFCCLLNVCCLSLHCLCYWIICCPKGWQGTRLIGLLLLNIMRSHLQKRNSRYRGRRAEDSHCSPWIWRLLLGPWTHLLFAHPNPSTQLHYLSSLVRMSYLEILLRFWMVDESVQGFGAAKGAKYSSHLLQHDERRQWVYTVRLYT